MITLLPVLIVVEHFLSLMLPNNSPEIVNAVCLWCHDIQHNDAHHNDIEHKTLGIKG
jgi:hypothetical protein